MSIRRTLALQLLLIASGSPLAAQVAPAYTRYELGPPGSGAFRILFDVTTATPGATVYRNTVRAGADVTVHGASDLRTGLPLQWRLAEGAIEVALAGPVAPRGAARVRIDKTYRDAASYFTDGNDVVFQRSLSVPLNAVVLPAGHELVHVNVPSQVDTEADGRIRVSFMNGTGQPASYTVRARALPDAAAAALATANATARSPSAPATIAPAAGAAAYDGSYARTSMRFSERAAESRDITYFLEQPESGAFRLHHDYTEARAGVDRYLNVVRAGSRVVDPQAYDLDGGRELAVETLRGDAALRRNALSAEQAAAGSEVVAVSFPAVRDGATTRLRIHETYIDTSRFVRSGDELVWDRNFGRARNSVVLPQGWFLTASSMPAVVRTREDGRTQLTFWNDRADGMQVFIRARQRSEPVARSIAGEALHARPHPDEAALRTADAALAAAPRSVDALLAAAREREQAFRYDAAAELYERVTQLAPEDWRGWRFRGHRMLSLRRFDEGVRDLERARSLAPENFDVAYHLGLGYYLQGRFGEAADEYLRCIALAADPAARARAAQPAFSSQRGCVRIGEVYDTRVAITEWAWRALRRAGRDAEARQLLDDVEPGMSVAANEAYYQALLVRRGEHDAADLLDPYPATGRYETRAYGPALDALLRGDEDRGLFLMRRIAADPHWPGFGRIAAEAELARRGMR